MAVSPFNGLLYISDAHQRRVVRVKTMGSVRDLDSNFELVAGSGQRCYPGDANRCGDGGDAQVATLAHPKGIAIDKDGVVFFADGSSVRRVDLSGHISTLIEASDPITEYRPLPCAGAFNISDVRLFWPTSLVVNPLDNSLHLIDDNVVLKITSDFRSVMRVAGRPLHCAPVAGATAEDGESTGERATDVILSQPQDIAFSSRGELFIVEVGEETSDDGPKTANRVRRVASDGSIELYAGASDDCSCDGGHCTCEQLSDEQVLQLATHSDVELATKAQLLHPLAVTLTPDDVVHVSDVRLRQVRSIVPTLPLKTNNMYEIIEAQTQEKFVFNQFGQHVATQHLVTGSFLYNFTYHSNTYHGVINKVTDAADNHLLIQRDFATQVQALVTSSGSRCALTIDETMGMLESFTTPDNFTTSYTYLHELRLIESKRTSAGVTSLFEYDANGRLSGVTMPTGDMLSLTTDVDATGAVTRVTRETGTGMGSGADAVMMLRRHVTSAKPIVLATNGKSLSLVHGKCGFPRSFSFVDVASTDATSSTHLRRFGACVVCTS